MAAISSERCNSSSVSALTRTGSRPAALHARGRTLQRVIRLLEDATQARSRAQAIEEQRREAERLMEAHKTHNARRRSAADTARAMAETTE